MTVGNVWAKAVGGSHNATIVVFIVNMPMCFYFVGSYLTKLNNDNRALRGRLDTMALQTPTASEKRGLQESDTANNH